MATSDDIFKMAIQSAEDKLKALETEQKDLERKITQIEAEVLHLTKAISSLQELDEQLGS